MKLSASFVAHNIIISSPPQHRVFSVTYDSLVAKYETPCGDLFPLYVNDSIHIATVRIDAYLGKSTNLHIVDTNLHIVDTIAVTDSVFIIKGKSLYLVDTVRINHKTGVGRGTIKKSEVIGISDDITKDISPSRFIDNVAVRDDIAKDIGPYGLIDKVEVIDDTYEVRIGASKIVDSITIEDTSYKTLSIGDNDPLSIEDMTPLAIRKRHLEGADVVSFTASLVKDISISDEDPLSIEDTLYKTLSTSDSDLLSIEDTSYKTLSIGDNDPLSIKDMTPLAIRKRHLEGADAISFTGSLMKDISISDDDPLSIEDMTPLAIRKRHLEGADVVSFTASLVKAISSYRSMDGVTISDDIVKALRVKQGLMVSLDDKPSLLIDKDMKDRICSSHLHGIGAINGGGPVNSKAVNSRNLLFPPKRNAFIDRGTIGEFYIPLTVNGKESLNISDDGKHLDVSKRSPIDYKIIGMGTGGLVNSLLINTMPLDGASKGSEHKKNVDNFVLEDKLIAVQTDKKPLDLSFVGGDFINSTIINSSKGN